MRDHQALHLQITVSHRTSSLSRTLDETPFLKSLTREEFNVTGLRVTITMNEVTFKHTSHDNRRLLSITLSLVNLNIKIVSIQN